MVKFEREDSLYINRGSVVKYGSNVEYSFNIIQ